MPKFSFIIPVYNVASYLEECLNTVLNQNYTDFEVCIVDDGSTDESVGICDKFAAKDNRIKLLHQLNKGVSVARNEALAIATGEYIWFVDADDFIECNSLYYLNAVLELSHCDTIFFGESRMQRMESPKYEMCEKHLFLCSHISFWNPRMIFRRSIIQEHHLQFTPGMTMAEDLEFQYKYLLHCQKPAIIPYNFYYIRERDGSASRNADSIDNTLRGNIIILTNILEYSKAFVDKGVDWLGIRMAERVKSLIHSAALAPEVDTKDINRLIRHFVRKYRSLGFFGFNDISLWLACIDIRLYLFVQKAVQKSKKNQNENLCN